MSPLQALMLAAATASLEVKRAIWCLGIVRQRGWTIRWK